ncbi:RNA polymerase sigma factor [Pelagicoccus sp. SDUM812003]|uniref:RNA polymerase sigma factor n=1 Tax=Pelagicoccus sp. SDUM812003 TaxID=3041267 RepID=UPI0028109BFC|nr:RNA polymerase sigma factor [Pelagicoccus sp. SDUM812003]MDQ8205268.1 RNA polymerase sigma factor [Pelagicoccus sp. SDUM812003]
MSANAATVSVESENTMSNANPARAVVDETELIQAGYRYALSIARHHQDAEDLVQQAWLKLQRAYGRVEGTPVLFRTIRNLFYDIKRRNKIVQFEPLEKSPEPGKSEANGVSMDMEIVMKKLRPEEREALYLNVVEGYTATEISDQTGSPRGTILSHIHRARQKLAKAFGGEFKDSSHS